MPPAMIELKGVSKSFDGGRTQAVAGIDLAVRQGEFVAIVGGSGSGKTTTISVIRSAVEMQGFQVKGFAPTSRAARQLAEAGVEAGTLQAFLAQPSAPVTPEHKHFYFVDESSLASTKQMNQFLHRLKASDRVLLVGDMRQHEAVEAGRPYQQLQEAGIETARLDVPLRADQ